MYYDDKPEEIDALADDAPHRPIDLAILKVKKELGEKAKIAIMIPPLIYGSKSPTEHPSCMLSNPPLTLPASHARPPNNTDPNLDPLGAQTRLRTARR